MNFKLKNLLLIALLQMFSFSAFSGIIITDVVASGVGLTNCQSTTTTSNMVALTPEVANDCEVKSYTLVFSSTQFLTFHAESGNWVIYRSKPNTQPLTVVANAPININDPNWAINSLLPHYAVYASNGVYMTTLTIIEGEEGELYISDYNGGDITTTEETCTMVGCTPSSKQSLMLTNTLNSRDNVVRELPYSELGYNTTVQNEMNQSANISPNPTNGIANLTFQAPSMGSAEISVYNTIGQLIQTITDFQTYKGKNQTTVDLSAYPAGLYHIRITQSDEIQTLQLQKI